MTTPAPSLLLGLVLVLVGAACPGSPTQEPDTARTQPKPPAAEQAPDAPETPRETKTMTVESDPVIQLLQLPDADYFTIGEDRLLELQDALSQAVEGAATDPAALPPRLALGAPTQVDTKAQSKVPVLLGSFQTGLRAWQVNFQPNLLILVKHHASGELVSATPLVNLRRARQPRASGGGTPPDALNATSTRSGVSALDLRERLGDSLRPGHHSVTALAYDLRSNTVSLDLQSDAPPVESFATPSPFVRHELDKRSILAPELDVPATGSARDGIKIRVAIQTTDEAAIVRTEFNQPVLSGHLILVRLDERAEIVPTFVPVQPVENGDGTPAYNALLIAELGGTAGRPISAGQYQVYVDVGVELRGPFGLLVTE